MTTDNIPSSAACECFPGDAPGVVDLDTLGAALGLDPSKGAVRLTRLMHAPDAWCLGNEHDSVVVRAAGGPLPGNRIPELAGVTDPSAAARIIAAHVDRMLP